MNHPSNPIRYILISVGIICVGLGIVGVFLPLLPTTPFMLLAAACFARSSPRFHQALLNNRTFGPIIHQWQTQRSIPKKARKQAIILIIAVFSISILFVIEELVVRLLLAVTAAMLIVFLLRIPSTEAATARQQ